MPRTAGESSIIAIVCHSTKAGQEERARELVASQAGELRDLAGDRLERFEFIEHMEVLDPEAQDATLEAHFQRLTQGRVVRCEIWLIAEPDHLKAVHLADEFSRFVAKLEQLFEDVGVSNVHGTLHEAVTFAGADLLARRRRRGPLSLA